LPSQAASFAYLLELPSDFLLGAMLGTRAAGGSIGKRAHLCGLLLLILAFVLATQREVTRPIKRAGFHASLHAQAPCAFWLYTATGCVAVLLGNVLGCRHLRTRLAALQSQQVATSAPAAPEASPSLACGPLNSSSAWGCERASSSEGGVTHGGDAVLNEELRETLICPITCALFVDPVIAPDGHTYERTAIEEWLSRNATSPLTGAVLAGGELRPNHVARSMAKSLAARGSRAHQGCTHLQDPGRKEGSCGESWL